MAKKKYFVNRPSLQHDGETFKYGDPIQLEADAAKPLIDRDNPVLVSKRPRLEEDEAEQSEEAEETTETKETSENS